MCYQNMKILDTVDKNCLIFYITQQNKKTEICLRINLIIKHIHFQPEKILAVKRRINYFDITLFTIGKNYFPFIEIFRLLQIKPFHEVQKL